MVLLKFKLIEEILQKNNETLLTIKEGEGGNIEIVENHGDGSESSVALSAIKSQTPIPSQLAIIVKKVI